MHIYYYKKPLEVAFTTYDLQKMLGLIDFRALLLGDYAIFSGESGMAFIDIFFHRDEGEESRYFT